MPDSTALIQELATRLGASILSSYHLKINSNKQLYTYELPEIFFVVLLKATKEFQQQHPETVVENFKNYKPVGMKTENEMTDRKSEQLAIQLYGDIKAEFPTPYHVKWITNKPLIKIEIPFHIKKALEIILFYVNIKELSFSEFGVLFDWFRINWQLCDI